MFLFLQIFKIGRTEWLCVSGEMEAKAGVEEAGGRGAEQGANSPATYKGYGTCLGTANGGLLNRGVYYFVHLLRLPTYS